jgi:hypothetical protein
MSFPLKINEKAEPLCTLIKGKSASIFIYVLSFQIVVDKNLFLLFYINI